MNNLKQKMKKINKQYEELIAEYRKVCVFRVYAKLILNFFYFRIPRTL